MKKIKLLLIILIVLITITGCKSREDVAHYTQEELINYVKHNILEETELIQVNTDNPDIYEYTFNLVNRDIEFKVEDIIYNDGLNIDFSQFYDDYKQYILLDDYVIQIKKHLEQERLNILRKYNFQEKYSEEIGWHKITATDESDLPELSKYIVELDNLYQFNINKSKLRSDNLNDSISFTNSKAFIESVSYFSSNTSRLNYKDVYNNLKNSYNKSLEND